MNKAWLNQRIASNLREAINTGLLSQTEPIHISGSNSAAPASNRVVWELNQEKTFLSAKEKIKIVSDSANDADAGTGARTVTITGLDEDYIEQNEDVTMNGVTAVATAKDYIRFIKAEVKTTGTGLKNAGNITILDNAAALYLGYMLAGENKTSGTFYTVPTDNVFYLDKIRYSEIAGKTTTIIIWKRKINLNSTLENNAFALHKEIVKTSNGEIKLETPLVFSEKDDVLVTANAGGGSGVISLSFEGFLLPV